MEAASSRKRNGRSVPAELTQEGEPKRRAQGDPKQEPEQNARGNRNRWELVLGPAIVVAQLVWLAFLAQLILRVF